MLPSYLSQLKYWKANITRNLLFCYVIFPNRDCVFLHFFSSQTTYFFSWLFCSLLMYFHFFWTRENSQNIHLFYTVGFFFFGMYWKVSIRKKWLGRIWSFSFRKCGTGRTSFFPDFTICGRGIFLKGGWFERALFWDPSALNVGPFTSSQFLPLCHPWLPHLKALPSPQPYVLYFLNLFYFSS